MEDSKDSQDIRHTRFRSHVLVRTLLENLLERLNVAELVEGGGGDGQTNFQVYFIVDEPKNILNT